MNCKMNPILYKWVCILREEIGIQLVPRREKRRPDVVDLILTHDFIYDISGHLNTYQDAEQCGYFVIIKKLRSAKRGTYHGKRVYQLFLSPIHPKKRREMNSTSEQTITISPLVAQYRLAA